MCTGCRDEARAILAKARNLELAGEYTVATLERARECDEAWSKREVVAKREATNPTPEDRERVRQRAADKLEALIERHGLDDPVFKELVAELRGGNG